VFGPLRSAVNATLTVALAPGIVSHEYAHVLGCRLWSVEIHSRPTLNLFGDDAYIEHASVDSFGADLTIALAPLLANALLGLVAFWLAATTSGLLAILPLWLGICFSLTAFPSRSDTDTLFETIHSLPQWSKPAAYLLATPAYGIGRIPLAGGVAGYCLIVALYVLTTTAVGG